MNLLRPPVSLALALALAAGPGAAADAVASYYRANGTVPPPYHWSLEASIDADGTVTVRFCRSYDRSPEHCGTAEGPAPQGAVDAIRRAAEAADIFARPIVESSDIPVGGGLSSGTVWRDGVAAEVPAFPDEADRARAQSVLDAITAAIPVSLANRAAELAPPE